MELLAKSSFKAFPWYRTVLVQNKIDMAKFSSSESIPPSESGYQNYDLMFVYNSLEKTFGERTIVYTYGVDFAF